MLNTSSVNYPIWSTEVDLLDIQEIDVELAVPWGPIRSAGKATPFSLVNLSPESPDAAHYFGAYTDADGHYEITGLPPGSYRVTINLHSGVNGTHFDWHDTVQIDGDTEHDLLRSVTGGGIASPLPEGSACRTEGQRQRVVVPRCIA